MTKTYLFENRKVAGKQLAHRLLAWKCIKPFVLVLPKGGVIVGLQVAKLLETSIDILSVTSISSPQDEDLIIGAVAPGGVVVLDNRWMRSIGIKKENLSGVADLKIKEVEKSPFLHNKKSNRINKHIKNHRDIIIIVDDGLSAGVVVRAAVQSVIALQEFSEIIFATPVCAKETMLALRDLVDVVCLEEVDDSVIFNAEFYRKFPQASSRQISNCIKKINNWKKISLGRRIYTTKLKKQISK